MKVDKFTVSNKGIYQEINWLFHNFEMSQCEKWSWVLLHLEQMWNSIIEVTSQCPITPNIFHAFLIGWRNNDELPKSFTFSFQKLILSPQAFATFGAHSVKYKVILHWTPQLSYILYRGKHLYGKRCCYMSWIIQNVKTVGLLYIVEIGQMTVVG